MRAVVQRVTKSNVSVDEAVSGSIGKGLMILLGINTKDSSQQADYIADKIANLRIFNDDSGKMNLSCLEVYCEALVIS